MTERQQQLLTLITEQYIDTAMPVGSKLLAGSEDLEVSAATIRNEMRTLEEEGFLTHPHTSAGRIPTQKGYRHYAAAIASAADSEFAKLCSSLVQQHEGDQAVKEIAKELSEQTGTALIVSFGSDRLYYTGISALFAQPEFRDHTHSVSVSKMFDQCEHLLPQIEQKLEDTVQIFIGDENPLGSECAAVSTRFANGIICNAVGPMRMQYKKTFSLMKTLQEVFS